MLKSKLVSSQEKAFVDDCIEKFEVLSNITALGGENLSVQLLYVDEGPDYIARRPICDVQVEGMLAPYVTLRDVRSVPVDRPINPEMVDENYLRTTPGIYPDILTPFRYGGKVVVSRDKLRSVWIEIRIPEDYSGDSDLSISARILTAMDGDTENIKFDNSLLFEQTLHIRVIPANLPEQELIFTQWFYCDCLASYYNVPVWSERHWEIIENYAALAVKRGRNMLYTPLLTPALNVEDPFERVPTQLVDVTVTDGVYSFCFDKVDRWVDMCDRLGVKYLEVSHFYHQHQAYNSAKVYGVVNGEYKNIFGWETLSTDPEYLRFLREMVTAFVTHMKARGDDKRCYYHITDEPTMEHFDRFCTVKNNVANILEGYKIMDALSDIEFYDVGAITAPVPATSDVRPFIEKNVPDLWVYYACNQLVGYSNCCVSMPTWRTRSIGMQLYKYNIAGFLHWGYNYYNNRASGDAINPYLDLGGEDWVCAGDTFVVYPNFDGTAQESIRMMALEEALQDVRAMRLAEKYYSHEEVVQTMEKALGAPITFTRCAYTADEMLRVRGAVNEMIEKAITG